MRVWFKIERRNLFCLFNRHTVSLLHPTVCHGIYHVKNVQPMLLRVHFWCDTSKKPAFLQPLPLLCSAAVMYEKACTIALNKIISTRTEWTVRYFTSEMAEFWFVCRSKPICVKPWIYVSMTSKTLYTISKCCPTRIPSSNASWLEDMTLAKEIQEQKGSLDNKTHGFSLHLKNVNLN